ncbi:DUF2460 domain-containing protein [Methylosinus sp. Ce-a6]|uniref:DUF2460 domain-containing protein n=1 Tax=Methylosinus sp. Ce-a6 TaxID=2172005 RepID=UPI00135B79C9|nr:DUF2460 domain-containing protein [Methylosinus sp. Ce-a6]
MAAFHEVRFPTDISLGARGGPERRTDVVTTRSAAEERNSIWAGSRRKYNAGYGVKTFAQLERVVAFWEERRGRLYGFRWKDRLDFKSSAAAATPTSTDQTIGTGTGAATTFQLVKTYGSTFAPWSRQIRKPVAGTVLVSVNGVQQTSGWTVDTTTGVVTFASAPANGAVVRAGFEFDVPARFDIDYLEVDYSHFEAGQIPNIPIVEIKV